MTPKGMNIEMRDSPDLHSGRTDLTFKKKLYTDENVILSFREFFNNHYEMNLGFD